MFDIFSWISYEFKVIQRKRYKSSVKLYHDKDGKSGNFLSFVSSGTLKLTEEPQNPFLVVEGDNMTLEWRYTFGEGDTFLSMYFEIGGLRPVSKFLTILLITDSFQDRLHASITNDYASITLLGVNRLETGSCKLELSSRNGKSTSSTVEISVLCKYRDLVKTRLHVVHRTVFLRGT